VPLFWARYWLRCFGRLRGMSSSMDFIFARGTRGGAVFAVFASPNEPVRRNQRDAARFRSPKSSHARSKVVALGNRTVVTGAGSFPTITRPTLFPSPVIPSPPSIKRRSSSRHDSKVCIGLQTVDSAHKSSTESAATSHKKMPRWPTIAPQLMAACGKLCRIIRDLGSGMVRGNSFKFEKRV
jgi:hypothetical protein